MAKRDREYVEFNRFDICEAAYVFAAECHGGQWHATYRILGRLHNMGFRPGAMGIEWDRLSENSQACYRNLWRHYYPGQPIPADRNEDVS